MFPLLPLQSIINITYLSKHQHFFQEIQNLKYGILLPKLFLPTVRKKCSSDGEKLLKFEAAGREFVPGDFSNLKI